MVTYFLVCLCIISTCKVSGKNDLNSEVTGTLIKSFVESLELLEAKHEKDIRHLEDKIANFMQEESTKTKRGTSHAFSGSTTYIRWGRTVCPTSRDTELVYKGYVAGSHYQQGGGGANYVCLSDNPKWEYSHRQFEAGHTGYESWLHGAEYEFAKSWPFKGSNIRGGNVFNQDVPCAACRTLGRSSVLMIPGTYHCPTGWQEEYHGYVTADYHGHHRTEYVCMDGYPEGIRGGSAHVNGALFYYTRGRCGPLPCPPYIDGREITCVVCSRN